LSKNNPKD
jgi:uncharacterized membrane protein